jgi:hypothetical protein
MNVAEKYKIQHRRVYDLFNLLTSLKVCRTIERGRIAWHSASEAFKTVTNEYVRIECDSLGKGMKQLFDLGGSPSLGSIATRFLSLFMYLGVDVIMMKQAVPIFHNPQCDIKSLERRLYLVLGMLDILNLVTHSKRTGEYRIVGDIQVVQRKAMVKKHKLAMKSFPYSLEANLNELGTAYMETLKSTRRVEYHMYSRS